MSPWKDYNRADIGHWLPDKQGPPARGTLWYLGRTHFLPEHWPQPPAQPPPVQVPENRVQYHFPLTTDYVTGILTQYYTNLLSEMGTDVTKKTYFLKYLRNTYHPDRICATENQQLILSYTEISQWVNGQIDAL